MDRGVSDSPWDDPGAQQWIGHVRETLVPMLDNSLVTVSLAPPVDSPDIKFAVELGLSIMMDKPLLLVVTEGRPVPTKLQMVADGLVYVDWSDPESQRNLQQEVADFAAQYMDEEL